MSDPDGYCEVSDLLIGDLILPVEIDAGKYITSAAEEMDSRIGVLYTTPIEIEEADKEKFRATITFLRSINARLASGRILMAAATALELTTVHAYARNLVEGALADLKLIEDRKYILQGAKENTNPPETYVSSRAYSYNQDAVSAVDGFYAAVDPGNGVPNKPAFMQGWSLQ